jgi:putative transposase
VGGEERGYDGGKKVKGRKRHLLVDAEGFVLKAKVHSAKVMDWDGIKTLLQRADEHFPRLKHLWVHAGYRGEEKGNDWVQKTLGWSVDLVERPCSAAPKEVLMAWAEQWRKEGVMVDWEKLLPPKGFVVLPRRWVVEIVRTQMTKTYMLAARVGGDHVADLHLLLGYDHPIDE